MYVSAFILIFLEKWGKIGEEKNSHTKALHWRFWKMKVVVI